MSLIAPLRERLRIKHARLVSEMHENLKTAEYVGLCLPDMKKLQRINTQHWLDKTQFEAARKTENYARATFYSQRLEELLPEKRLIENNYYLKRKRGE